MYIGAPKEGKEAGQSPEDAHVPATHQACALLHNQTSHQRYCMMCH